MTNQEIVMRNVIDGVIRDLSLCVFIMGFIALIIFIIYSASSKIASMIMKKTKWKKKDIIDWEVLSEYQKLSPEFVEKFKLKHKVELDRLSKKISDDAIQRKKINKEERKYWSIYG